MAYKTLKALGLPFNLIRSEDIRDGCLRDYKTLFVPGGWSSNKLKSLGDNGTEEIRRFVKNGGNYLGFCGGAGLATLDGIGLLKIRRMPTKQRVPSFSGRICLKLNNHQIWKVFFKGNSDSLPVSSPILVKDGIGKVDTSLPNLQSSPVFHAWWPPQFIIDDSQIKILATYGEAMSDAFSSDLNVGDIESRGSWADLENIYQINLAPGRLINEPAVVEGMFGKGKVILSLVHFDTPGDENGAAVLKSLWEYLSKEKSKARSQKSENHHNYFSSNLKIKKLISEFCLMTADLINLGIRNFLWFWRNPMLLQWRRGVRGLEYCTLYVMIKEIAEMLSTQNTGHSIQYIESELNTINGLLIPFVNKAKKLLIIERLEMQNGHITYEKCSNAEAQQIRFELFGNSKSYGGLFKELIDKIDDLTYKLIKSNSFRR